MKKFFKKALAAVLASAMVIGAMTFTAAADEESYKLFIGYGGQEDWSKGYDGETASGLTAVDAEIKVGETQTVSIEFADPTDKTWWMAPVLVAEGVTSLDVTVSVKIDGEDVAIDATAGDAWWYEETGVYKKDQAIRLYGGCNEWGANFIEQPANVTKIEYTVTLNALSTEEAAGDLVEADGEYDVFVAFGADKEAGDWGYNLEDCTAVPEGATMTNAKIKVGDTVTVGVEFATASPYVWYTAPCVVIGGVAEADFTVETYINGELVATDAAAGDNWWAEDTAGLSKDTVIRLNGGYNEWGAKYIAEAPTDVTKIEYKVTANKIMLGEAPETDAPVVGDEDVADPGYNAYFQAQTKAFTFRNNWDEPTYGFGTDDFSKVIWWNGDEKAYVDGVKITDALNISGNGVYYIVVEGWSDPSENGEWNMLGFSTDIPSGKGIEISAKCYINGKAKYSEALTNAADENAYIIAAFVNEYNDELKGQVDTLQPKAGARIVMELTVTGMDSDNADAVKDESIITGEAASDATEAPATTEAPKAESNSGVPFWVWIIVGGVVVVVAVVVVVCVVVSKKKKNA